MSQYFNFTYMEVNEREHNLNRYNTALREEEKEISHREEEENPIIDNYQHSDFINFWHNIKNDMSDGTYRIKYSRYGILGIKKINSEDSEEEEEKEKKEEKEEKIITKKETFKSPCCVLCLDEEKQANVLFCNCGHLCICESCDEIYISSNCPICKTENSIRRKI